MSSAQFDPHGLINGPFVGTSFAAESWFDPDLRHEPAAVAGNDMTATGTLSISGAADLDATGTLVAVGALSITGVADLDASGALIAAGALSITGAADLDAVGRMIAAGALSITGTADLDAIGQLSAAGLLEIIGAADLTSPGGNDIAAAGLLQITGAAILTATGQLVADGLLEIIGLATLTDGAVAPQPQPEPTQTPAGKKRKKRYQVEIDGHIFEVNSYAEAEALLLRARDLARVAAGESVRKATKRVRRKGKAFEVKPPIVSTPNYELQSLVQEYRSEIEAIYAQLALDAEIRQLLARKLAEEADEEESILLLLH
jgi:hypothetical protein